MNYIHVLILLVLYEAWFTDVAIWNMEEKGERESLNLGHALFLTFFSQIFMRLWGGEDKYKSYFNRAVTEMVSLLFYYKIKKYWLYYRYIALLYIKSNKKEN